MCRPQGVALSVFVPPRISGDDFHDQMRQGLEQLDVRVGLEAIRVALFGPLGRSLQSFQLLHDAIVEQQGPAVAFDQSATSPSMSSSSAAGRSSLASMA